MKYSSTNVTELQALVEAVNATVPHGGGDCAELGMTGILNALSLSSPDSNVIVLTDAAAKDVNRTDEVIQTAKKLRNAIHFFLSDQFCENDTEYIEVANATNGIVVNTITDFEAFAQFADAAVGFEFISTLPATNGPLGKRQTTNEVCIQFVANIFTVDINLLLMAPGNVFDITIPNGELMSLNVSGAIGTFSDSTPQPGQYEVCSDMGNFEYALSAPTALDFFVEYLENETYSTTPPPAGMVDTLYTTYHYVLLGSYVTVVVVTSRLADISMNMTISLSLIDADSGVKISTVPLILCGDFLSGSVMIPNITFQYQLRGTDIRGFGFEHKSNRLVVPTTFDDERSIIQLDCPVPSTSPPSSPSSTTLPSSTPSTTPSPPTHGGGAVTNFIKSTSTITSIIIAIAVIMIM